VLLGAFALLIAGLFVVASLQKRGADAQTRAENRRARSFLVADSMRQSSNDLTNMVRLYVGTGDPRFRAYYEEILTTRSGSSPRPRDYDSSFWDRVLAEGKGFVRYGPPRSLIDQMRDARFAPAEFGALRASLDASNGLAVLERQVMQRVARRIRRGVDPTYAHDVRADYRRLTDAAYLRAKGRIMRAIGRFTALVQARTDRDVQRARDNNRRLAAIQLGILVLVAVVGLGAFALLTRLVLRPLERLTVATRRMADGDYGVRAEIRSVSDLERVAGSFNEMADAVEADVSARRVAEQGALEAREAAELANRAKSTFLATMSHELRTPMIGVTGMLELLGRTELTADQRQLVTTAEGSARSLVQIVGDVLDLSKIEADKLELAPATIDVREVVSAVVDGFVHTASAKGLLLSCRIAADVAPAHVADPLRLRQIIANFLSNAIKFTEVGRIDVDVRVAAREADAQRIEVAVSDTGIGIDEDSQRRLFADFAQADETTSRRFGGSGLGLVICRRLALLMGGDVTLDSTPGTGTTMRLTVPLALGDPAAIERGLLDGPADAVVTRPLPTREQAEREGSLVLLAEDHSVNRIVLCHQLQTVGFHADTAADGEEALARWRAGDYALVLTDLDMPRMDGFELARAIRADEREHGRRRTPIVALTASMMQGEAERCREAGMDDFAAKPTTIAFLAGKLRELLPDVGWDDDREDDDRQDDDRQDAAAPPTARPIDPSVLELLAGGDDELVVEVLDDFIAATDDDLVVLRDHAGGGGAEQLRRIAHRVKGAARAVGAGPLADTAQKLERLGADGAIDRERALALIDELAAALEQVRLSRR
jgi:signal transduction histidine kinase/DNA-binding NarL/FixJ family response regulator